MALKDWKKVKEDIDKDGTEIIYRNKNTLETLSIFDTDMNVSTHKWGVQNNTLSVNKGFKTKSQALAFAKQYMRKH